MAIGLLLAEKTWDAVIRLRWVLVAHACTAGLAILIDLKYFPRGIPERFSATLAIAVWIAYFY